MPGMYDNAGRYDLLYAHFTDDLRFYDGIASTLRDAQKPESLRICDLACGTGRVTLPLARRHPTATLCGVDNSAVQLDLARRRAADEGIENVDWINDSMETVVTSARYDLAICALHSLEHLTEESLVDRFFVNLRERVLRPGGFFAFALHLPDPAYLNRDPDALERVGEYGEGEERFVLYEQASYDNAAQLLSLNWFFEPSIGDVTKSSYELRLFYPREIRRILKQHGFRIDGVYGWYDQTPLTGRSGSQVILAAAPGE